MNKKKKTPSQDSGLTGGDVYLTLESQDQIRQPLLQSSDEVWTILSNYNYRIDSLMMPCYNRIAMMKMMI